MSPRVHVALLSILVVATGANAILIEQAFEKILSTVVGASTPAASIVLATYFIGLAAGGLLYPRLRARVKSPFLLYGAVEAAVGVYALAIALALSPLQLASMRLMQLAGTDSLVVLFVRVAVAAIWVLPPTLCLGASFPAVVSALTDQLGASEQRLVARLYSWNVLGAALGSIGVPYLAFSYLGLRGGLFASAAMQLVVVAVCLAAAPSMPRAAGGGAPLVGLRTQLRDLMRFEHGVSLGLVAFGSGAIIFGCEVVWLHLMGVTLGMSVFNFGALLIVVLVSLFIGGTVVSNVLPSRSSLPASALAAALVCGSVLLMVTSRAWDDVPVWIVEHGADIHTFLGGELLRGALAAIVVVPACAVLGTVYPLLFRSDAFPMAAADRMAGALSALNALGAMTGALLVPFVAIPTFGSEGTLYLLAIAPAALALVTTLSRARKMERTERLRALAAPVLVSLVVIAVGGQPVWDPLRLTAGTNVYFRPYLSPGARIAFWHEDAQGGITTVAETMRPERATPVRTLLTNGKFQGNDDGEMIAQTGFALVPLSLSAARGRALVIGLGTGYSAHVVASAGFAQVEIADFAEGVIAAARGPFGAMNGHVLEQANVTLFVEDGRNHLLRSTQSYDLITMELSSVWFAGVGNLYAKEMYDLAAARLAPGGVVQQWIQLHHIAADEVASALAAARAVFPHVSLWFVGGQGIITASREPQQVLPAAIAQLRGAAAFAPILATFEAETESKLEDLADARVLDDAAVDRLIAGARARGVPTHSDANRYLEYWTPRHNLEKVDFVAANLAVFKAAATPAPQAK